MVTINMEIKQNAFQKQPHSSANDGALQRPQLRVAGAAYNHTCILSPLDWPPWIQ